ncbi:hypothetical protein RclHR1_00810012 [Rhizophagus clarus]|nr:hypothetical protein RclHR1_00810012 [Rhizophagus clarus]
MLGGPASNSADFTKECKEKKEGPFQRTAVLKVLARYGIDSNSTDTILIFPYKLNKIQDSNKYFEHYMENFFVQDEVLRVIDCRWLGIHA